MAIAFSICGQIGIILVAVFDTVRYSHVHIAMLCLFLVGCGLSIFCTTCEFFVLDRTYRDLNKLRISYFIKGVWLVIAIILVIFLAAFWRNSKTVAAVFEWALAFWYGFYLLVLSYDLFPAATTKRGQLLEQNIGATLSRAASWLPGLHTTEDGHEKQENYYMVPSAELERRRQDNELQSVFSADYRTIQASAAPTTPTRMLTRSTAEVPQTV